MTYFPLSSSLTGTIKSTRSHLVHQSLKGRKNCSIDCLYVDDVVLFGDDTDEIVQLKKKMRFKFEIKDLGTMKYFLRIRSFS